jgi:C4-dicarboxylate-specific signal transduction histidine kinase
MGFDPNRGPPSFQTALSRFHKEDRPFIGKVLNAAIRERKAFDFDARLSLPDGSIKYVHSIGRPLANVAGELEFVGAIQDVTQRKREEESLQETRAQLAHAARVTTMGEMAAVIAHEINQPLAAVVTNANASTRWLAGSEPDLDEARAAVSRIASEGKRASEVLSRIRTLMKKGPPRREAVDLNDVVQQVLELVRSQVMRHGISIRKDLAADLPAITGDAVQLQQVLLNLVLNGIEAIAEQHNPPKEIAVWSQKLPSGDALVGVRDSGEGVDAAQLDQLFKPFFTTKQTGMGMGLSIGRSIIEAHGGRLWATLNGGPGITFRFSIPARADI